MTLKDYAREMIKEAAVAKVVGKAAKETTKALKGKSLKEALAAMGPMRRKPGRWGSSESAALNLVLGR